jgi:hypothetical protein
MPHKFYSQRNGLERHPEGLPHDRIVDLFAQIFAQFEADGYFQEAFGIDCTDGFLLGKVANPQMDILLSIRKDQLWPIAKYAKLYNEADLFDMIEYAYQHVSKPTEGHYHDWNGCGTHHTKFDQPAGREEFLEKINNLLEHNVEPFELTKDGVILRRPEEGFEQIFEAALPTSDKRIEDRVTDAIAQFRNRGATISDRRKAVRELADVLELLRPQVKSFLTNKDDADLFNIANNFGIRHLNDKQQTGYDAALWLSWMFYFYLATIHVVLRKMKQGGVERIA